MPTLPSLELWGGLECTVARVGDRYRDQIAETGHGARLEDLDRIAALGIRTLRYPVIWETVSPERPDRYDWSWHDERLGRLRQLGLTPIAGLIHHGSGPRYTNLLDPAFPELLAGHAAAVARRYPWIGLYTPVNEPLTTARFTGLYGHWYPHETSYRAFLKALVAQCWATVLSMRAIRKVNPDARLVQTDDLGRTFSTPALAYQAEHENERRWLSFDLLCGRVDEQHPWWPIFREHGIPQRQLELFLAADGAPDIIGINHYLTSERFLDARVGRYPQHLWGGNAWGRYADVEAVRMPLPEDQLGPAARLMEVWDRYRRPIAVTEVHHGCTRDEQLRWLSEVWQAAETVRSQGADLRAVTIWSLFGTTDWNSLLTREDGVYEPGPFDVRGPEPRPTALARAAASLASSGSFDHPVLDRPGWWRRDSRFYRPVKTSRSAGLPKVPRSLLIIGAEQPLAAAYSRIALERGLDHELVCSSEVVETDALDDLLGRQRAWAVIDTLAIAPEGLLQACHARGLRYLSVSSAAVFDGGLGRAYAEDDAATARDPEGKRTAAAEGRIAASCPDSLVVRAGPLFGPWDGDNFAWRMLHGLASGDGAEGDAQIVSPSYLPDFVHCSLDLLIDGERGIWHLANVGQASGSELVRGLGARAGVDWAVLDSPSATQPRNLALGSRRGLLMPSLDSALDRFVRECEVDWMAKGDIVRIAAE